ncbi:MAG: hypothetical protein HRT47_03170 [Candidatus Caenarcaniphilales bacterium]|nr:hypothetical protein [Candidatus Caenarcaniphilales bacterium]
MNNSEENLDDFLNDLRGETSAALPSEDDFKLDLQINQNYSKDSIVQDELKHELIRESAQLNLNLPEQKQFNEALDENLGLAEELLNFKKEANLNLSKFNEPDPAMLNSMDTFDLALIGKADLHNPVIEKAFIDLYKNFEELEESIPPKLNELLIDELKTVNEKIDTDLEENLYVIILDSIKSDTSFEEDTQKTYTELRLKIFDNIEIELNEDGLEILSTKDQELFNLIDKAEKQKLDTEEFNIFTTLIDKEEYLLAETLVDMKTFKILDSKSLELLNHAQNIDFDNEEKEEFAAYLLIENSGFNFAKTFSNLKEADKLTDSNREQMYKSLGLHLFSDELNVDITQNGVNFNDSDIKDSLEKRLKVSGFEETNKEVFKKEIIDEFLNETGKHLNLKPPKIENPVDKKENMTLIEKGLKGLLEGDEVRQLIDLVGKFNLLKFGLESHLTTQDLEKLSNNPDKSFLDAEYQKLAFLEIANQVEFTTQGLEFSLRDTRPQALLDRGLKGELAADEIIIFIEMVGRDNLLKYGLEGYPLGKDEDEYQEIKKSILGEDS